MQNLFLKALLACLLLANESLGKCDPSKPGNCESWRAPQRVHNKPPNHNIGGSFFFGDPPEPATQAVAEAKTLASAAQSASPTVDQTGPVPAQETAASTAPANPRSSVTPTNNGATARPPQPTGKRRPCKGPLLVCHPFRQRIASKTRAPQQTGSWASLRLTRPRPQETRTANDQKPKDTTNESKNQKRDSESQVHNEKRIMGIIKHQSKWRGGTRPLSRVQLAALQAARKAKMMKKLRAKPTPARTSSTQPQPQATDAAAAAPSENQKRANEGRAIGAFGPDRMMRASMAADRLLRRPRPTGVRLSPLAALASHRAAVGNVKRGNPPNLKQFTEEHYGASEGEDYSDDLLTLNDLPDSEDTNASDLSEEESY